MVVEGTAAGPLETESTAPRLGPALARERSRPRRLRSGRLSGTTVVVSAAYPSLREIHERIRPFRRNRRGRSSIEGLEVRMRTTTRLTALVGARDAAY